ncbi:MAG: lipase maturation factor family protein, partial [Kofleriaceae bacterium]
WLILRLLGLVYVFAFLGILLQGLPLLGSHGLTPAAVFVDHVHQQGGTFWTLPSIFMVDCSDTSLQLWGWIGFAISLAVLAGYANLPMLLVLWAIYGSFERVGQIWWAFGWEMQLLETTLMCAVLVHPWDPRPLAARSPPTTAIVLLRWLAFRIMLGAGLIKLRGDPCWRDLTCLDHHFETQPIPNPLSPWFHHLPHAVHAGGVIANHLVEVVAPWFAFGPRRLRLIAGVAMASFQGVLILSGNLAFLNWLTLVPILACFDDDFLKRLLPKRARAWLTARLPASTPRDGRQLAIAFGLMVVVILVWSPVTDWLSAQDQVALGAALFAGASTMLVMQRRRIERRFGIGLDGHQLLIGAFAALVAIKSVAVVENLASSHQAMNESFDRLELVNTYGAFGSVGTVRHELVIEGTRDADPDKATWQPYELPCKPGPLDRRPCILGPYHLRLDWLIWFSAMQDHLTDPWLLHLVYKLLDGDTTVRELLAVDPFDGKPPTFVRIRRFEYHFGTRTWWTRDHEELWLPPIALDEPGLRETLERYGWPSPSSHD